MGSLLLAIAPLPGSHPFVSGHLSWVQSGIIVYTSSLRDFEAPELTTLSHPKIALNDVEGPLR